MIFWRFHFSSLHASKISTRCLQDPQDLPQMPPRCSPAAPHMHQDGPKMPPRCPKMPQYAPRCTQDAPKMLPRSPKMPPRSPKMPPRCPKNARRMTLNCFANTYKDVCQDDPPCNNNTRSLRKTPERAKRAEGTETQIKTARRPRKYPNTLYS